MHAESKEKPAALRSLAGFDIVLDNVSRAQAIGASMRHLSLMGLSMPKDCTLFAFAKPEV